MSRQQTKDLSLFCLLLAIAAGSRLMKEWLQLSAPNFHAVAAVSLFAGFYYRNTWVALALPILAMLASDCVIGGYEAEVMLAVYISLALPIAGRYVLRSGLTAGRVAACSLTSSIAFFLITNFAVWHASYHHTWATLIHCYARALPFFSYTLLGDLGFAAAIFGAYALATLRQPAENRLVSLS